MKRERKREGMKKLFFGLGVLFLCCGYVSFGEAVVDRIVAVVNQEVITFSEVQRMSRSLQQDIQSEDRLERRERIQEVFRKVLDRMIEDKLIEQEAAKSGIKVTSKEIEGAVEEVKQKNGIDQAALENALAAEGMTLEAFKKELERRILRSKFIHLTIKVEQKAGEKDLMDFFQKNVNRYRIDVSYRPAHILFLISPEATPEQVRSIRRRSQKVLEKIRAGADFTETAMAYSEDTSSRQGGGDLGYFRKGELLPALERAATKLQVGEVSDLIRTEFGFHILKLLDRKGGTPPPFEEIKERVREDYYVTELEKAYQQFLGKLKEKSVIEIKL